MKRPTQPTRDNRYAQVIADQEQWIKTCGGDAEGYALNFKTDPAGRYERDVAYLNTLREAAK